MPPYRDSGQARTYRAEKRWQRIQAARREIPNPMIARAFLSRFIPPVLLEHTVIEPLPSSNRTMHGRLIFTGYDQWQLEAEFPTTELTLMHEGAHLLVEAHGGRELHDAEFRRTLAWIVRQVRGVRSAAVLRRCYQQEGLEI